MFKEEIYEQSSYASSQNMNITGNAIAARYCSTYVALK